MPEKTERGALLKAAHRKKEQRMARDANRAEPRPPCEVDEEAVIVGRRREAQLILEAERYAARAKGATA